MGRSDRLKRSSMIAVSWVDQVVGVAAQLCCRWMWIWPSSPMSASKGLRSPLRRSVFAKLIVHAGQIAETHAGFHALKEEVTPEVVVMRPSTTSIEPFSSTALSIMLTTNWRQSLRITSRSRGQVLTPIPDQSSASSRLLSSRPGHRHSLLEVVETVVGQGVFGILVLGHDSPSSCLHRILRLTAMRSTRILSKHDVHSLVPTAVALSTELAFGSISARSP